MKSSNPTSGIYKAETSRTLDFNGGNPACNQGGVMVLDKTASAIDARNGTLSDTNGTLQGAADHNLNCNNTVLEY